MQFASDFQGNDDMEQFVTGIGFASLEGAVTALSGIVIGVVIALLTGALIPRKVHNDRLADRDKIIAYLTKANVELTIATRNFSTSGETTDRLHTALSDRIQQEVNDGTPSGPTGG